MFDKYMRCDWSRAIAATLQLARQRRGCAALDAAALYAEVLGRKHSLSAERAELRKRLSKARTNHPWPASSVWIEPRCTAMPNGPRSRHEEGNSARDALPVRAGERALLH